MVNKMNIKNKVKILFCDVDGTLTDGKIYMGQNGELFKAFHVLDGYGLNSILKEHNIIPYILTARNSEIVNKRCEELNIKNICQNCKDKKNEIIKIATLYGFTLNDLGKYEEFAYIGDDIVDLAAMELCSVTACPNNAVKEVKCKADFICQKSGGDGAVREFIEWLCIGNN